ncbi:MAG: isoleucine--tRNA ligase [Theionarchaea archaeon]|nr:isoleucine--tRNA ligase [Theionarchaea archaeon]MBU7037165.1 isoleucine--tRNA ligase [Theionarchaea archaeon]
MKEVGEYSPNQLEERTLEYWKKNDTFLESLRRREDAPPFIFVEGPPTANGLPGVHHILARAMKDAFCRYKHMSGYLVKRKGGWDTHGLPVELEVEKELNINSKREIEEYGIEKFNQKCKESVFRYEKEWRAMTERMAFWIDMDNPYITLKNEYMESVWWSLKEIWKKGLLYKGHKIIPYCPRCGTALSTHEMAQGYRTVTEPSVYVKFMTEDKSAYFLAWTTTPWTLLANLALTVHPDYTYVKVNNEGNILILVKDRLDILEGDFTILEEFPGRDLEGMRYHPLFEYCNPEGKRHVVILGDFVTTDEGTGIVHTAPAFGEEDYVICRENNVAFCQPVEEDGRFSKDVVPLAGVFVKDADEQILEMLDDKRLLYKIEPYTHEYPFCWRCDTALLYYARESWFIKMTEVRDKLVQDNDKVNWTPSHIKHGRFGNFLENVRDWSLSRERYWGTPLPIWVCECGLQECIGSVQELREKGGHLPEDFDLHRPYVDEILLKCPECGGTMKRVPDVIDCWYDSGSAPFAQWHYPFENQDVFSYSFPADFISEALDQTRGWFYSLHALGTLLFETETFRNCVCDGLVLGRDGSRMSKSRGTAVDPWAVFQSYGADAIRWYLYSVVSPGENIRFSEEAVEDVYKGFLNTLWNVYSFYVTYALIDEYHPDEERLPVEERPVLDRWMESRLHSLVQQVVSHLDSYEVHLATRAIEDFVTNEVSNWYVRRSRRRFWKLEKDRDKKAAYDTLTEVMDMISRLIAPFMPYISEEIYRNVLGKESVHFSDYPVADVTKIDTALESQMEKAVAASEAGRAARAEAGIKLRQPIAKAVVITGEPLGVVASLIKEELNVKALEVKPSSSELMEFSVKLNYKNAGPKYKQKVGAVEKALAELDPRKVKDDLTREGVISVTVESEPVELTEEDVVVKSAVTEGYTGGESQGVTVFVETGLTEELKKEGLARDIVRRIQEMRKEMKLDYKDSIQVYYTGTETAAQAVREFKDYIKQETLATILEQGQNQGYTKSWTIEGETIELSLAVQ